MPKPGIFWNICSKARALNFAVSTVLPAATLAVRGSLSSRPISPMVAGCFRRPISRRSPSRVSAKITASPSAMT